MPGTSWSCTVHLGYRAPQVGVKGGWMQLEVEFIAAVGGQNVVGSCCSVCVQAEVWCCHC